MIAKAVKPCATAAKRAKLARNAREQSCRSGPLGRGSSDRKTLSNDAPEKRKGLRRNAGASSSLRAYGVQYGTKTRTQSVRNGPIFRLADPSVATAS